MKKMTMIVIVLLLILMATGCGKKKTDNTQKKTSIKLNLGSTDTTFMGEEISCGNYKIQSKVDFLSEASDNGNYKGSYEFYECNNNNINLQTAEGTYEVTDETIEFTDSYGEVIVFEATSEDTIEQKEGKNVVRTFTK